MTETLGHATSDAAGWPTGTVTFLMTDVVGSSALAEADHERYLAILDRHDALAREAVGRGGAMVKHRGEGDSTFAAFASAEAGARAGAEFVGRAWRELGIELRAALHCGTATFADGDYRGDAVNRCGRLRSLAGARQVLVSGAVAALLPPGLASPRGSVRLRGLVRPMEVFVLAGEGLSADAAPSLGGLSGERRGNLTPPTGTLYGREGDLAALGRAFARGRLVELVGPGGMGKTRLALEFGARAGTGSGAGFPGGAWFVDLTRTEGAPIEPTVLAQLGLSAPGERDAAAAVAEALGSREGGEALLILDNCEHVAPAAAGFVRRLAGLAPSLRVLATSLEHLPVRGMATVPLGPLAWDGADGTDGAAVRMLREIAAEKAVPVEGSDEEVAGLCRDLDGLPLAIELVVPRLRTLSVAGVRARLDRWLRRGSDGGAGEGVTERHASLGALVAYSLGRLSLGERDLLEGLAPFAGGFGLEHAEAVCACEADEVEATFGSLLERSMVSPDERASDALGGEHRFRLLSAVRAGVRAGTADPRARGASFVAWGVGFAQSALAGGPPFAAVRGEIANLEAAFDDALELGDALSAARIAKGLRKPYLADFDARSGRRLYEALAPHLEGLPPDDRADALNSLGIFRMHQREFASARRALESASRLYEAAGQRDRLPIVGLNLAIVRDGEGDHRGCVDEARRALEGFRASGDPQGISRASLTLALGLLRSGAEAEADALIVELEARAAEGGNGLLVDAYHSSAAVEFLLKGRDREAVGALRRIRGEDAFVEPELATALLAAGSLLYKGGDVPLAARCLRSFESSVEARGLTTTQGHREIIGRMPDARSTGQEGGRDLRALWSHVRPRVTSDPSERDPGGS